MVFKNWGIRDRMLLLALLPPALIAMIIGFYLINIRIQDLNQAHLDRGQAMAQQFAPVAEHSINSGNRDLLFHIMNAMLADRAVLAVQIRDAQGRRLIHQENQAPVANYKPTRLNQLLRQSIASSTNFSAPIHIRTADGIKRGSVIIELSRTETQTRQLQVLFNGILITGLGLMASFLLALSTSRDVIIPIMRLTRAVRSFRRGELTRRVPETSGGELGTLERGINAMAEALQSSRQELQGQIYQSNSELRQTLEELEIKNVELDLARRRAEEISRIKSNFLANMSHEIRTPINGIIGFTKLLAQRPLEQEPREYVRIIQKSADNLLSIINDILDFSRIEAGKLIIDEVDFDLESLIEETVSLMAPLAYEKQLELIYLIYQDVPTDLRGDPMRLRQILTNLLSNAVKFTPRGQIAVRVMKEEENEHEVSIKVTVSDSGIGIGKEQQKLIFEAFTQADSQTSRQFGGTGLGLFITERLLQAMRGRIGFQSTPGQGSKFWFMLPLQKQEAIPASCSVPSPLAGRRVLLYEPYHLASLALRHLLQKWEMEVVELDSEAQLQNYLTERAHGTVYDFILLGLTAENATTTACLELIGQLRRHEPFLITLINSMNLELMQRIEQAGAHLCLPKIINQRQLHEQMCQLIGNTTKPVHAEIITTWQTASAPALADLSLLVADDNRINLRLLTTLLRGNGAHVDEAEGGAQAVELFSRNHYDAVLLDVHMPVVSGIEAMKRMRALESPGHYTPIFAITANAIPEEWRRFRQEGMDDCLIKPIDEDALIRLLQNWCTGKPMNQRQQPQGEFRLVPASMLNTITDPQILAMLREDLPRYQQTMKLARDQQNMHAMAEHVHLIHGTAAYCKLPEIKHAAHALERRLRQGGDWDDQIKVLTSQLDDEVSRFLHTLKQTAYVQDKRQTGP